MPSRATWVYLGLVAFSIAGSLLSMLTYLNPGPIAPIASLLTLSVGLIAVFEPLRVSWKALFCIVALGAVVELVGVTTGLPFGNYSYTSKWWPTLLLPGGERFPLLVPLAWGLTAGGSARFIRDLLPRMPLLTYLCAAGLTAALIDLVMEPVMTGPLQYWRWVEPGDLPGGAPVINFFGWLLTAAAAAWIDRGHRVQSALVARADDRPRRLAGHFGQAGYVLAGHLALMLGLGLIGPMPVS